MVLNTFSEVKNKNVKPDTWPEHPFNAEEHFQRKWYIVPISDIRKLNLLFPSPDFSSYYRSKVLILKILTKKIKMIHFFLLFFSQFITGNI